MIKVCEACGCEIKGKGFKVDDHEWLCLECKEDIDQQTWDDETEKTVDPDWPLPPFPQS